MDAVLSMNGSINKGKDRRGSCGVRSRHVESYRTRTPEASRNVAGGADHRFRIRGTTSPGRGDGIVTRGFHRPSGAYGFFVGRGPVACTRLRRAKFRLSLRDI